MYCRKQVSERPFVVSLLNPMRAGLKLGAIAQPLRAALTGRTTSAPIFDVLAVLGRDESLARLRDQAAP